MADRYDYVIVGGGVAGYAAIEGIREIDKAGRILLVAAENDLPYDRPPLSKQLWKGDQKIGEIFKQNAQWYEKNGVELRLGKRVVSIDRKARTASLDDGGQVAYQKLLLATGGKPRRLPVPGGDLEEICYYRNAADYRTLRPLVTQGTTALVVGSGFIGSEMAAALATVGAKVTLIAPGSYLCRHILPESIGKAMNALYIARGVELLLGHAIRSISRRGGGFEVKTEQGRTLSPQIIVAGVGIEADVEVARATGLKVGNGIEVDEYLRTSDPGIYAGGDVASFPDEILGRRRVEHWDNALAQGHDAGKNMAGANARFSYMPFFFSDLFEYGYEAVGDCDSSLQTYVDWIEPEKTGVVYYLKDSKVRGVLTWGIFGKTDAAREIIRRQSPVREADLTSAIRPS